MKKAQGLPMSTIVLLIMVVIVLAAVAIFFFVYFSKGSSSANIFHCQQLCETEKAICKDTSCRTATYNEFCIAKCNTTMNCSYTDGTQAFGC